jgi:hypothetical protein
MDRRVIHGGATLEPGSSLSVDILGQDAIAIRPFVMTAG